MDIPLKVDLRARLPATGDGPLPQWPASPTPFTAYSNGPGLAELLRFYVCLQPRPFGRVFIVKVSLNDNEYSRGSGNPRALILLDSGSR
jgi:hypothetical protein